MKRLMWFAIAVTLVACGSKDEKKTDNAAAAKPLAKGEALVEITVSGEITKTLSGPIGKCAGATFTASDGEIELSLVANSEGGLETAKVSVTQSMGRSTYNPGKTAPTVKLVAGKSASVEGDFDKQGALEGSVHVKGTFTCGQ